MTATIDGRQAATPPEAGRARLLHIMFMIFIRPQAARKKKWPQGSPQPIEKARSGQGNPRKSKPFFFDFLGLAWAELAALGKIWD
jgi:hypothetical protein